MPKAYYADLGLGNALVKDFRLFDLKQDKGMIYENFIFRQFADRLDIDDIKFWRTQPGNEIDFIIQDRFAYEVKYNLDTLKLNKYRAFSKLYPEKDIRFIYHEGNPPDTDPHRFLRF